METAVPGAAPVETGAALSHVSENGSGPDVENLVLPPENPFLDLVSAFATELDEVRFDFTLEDKPAYVLIRPMEADAMENFQQIGQKVRVDTTERVVKEAFFEEDRLKQYLELLVNSVVDYHLWRKVPRKGPGPGPNIQDVTLLRCRDDLGRLKLRAEREADFRAMRPRFFRRLVRVCLEANYLDPLTYGLGTEA